MASAATAVRSLCLERGWLRSTSCIPSRSASMRRTTSANRPSSTWSSVGERPLRMLNVAIRMRHRARTRRRSCLATLGVPRAMTEQESEQHVEALKQVAVALKDIGVAFALAGGYAAWVHGAPESTHDVDFLIADSDTQQVADELRDRGFEVTRPAAEDWLFKLVVDGADVDILHRALSGDLAGVLERAVNRSVLSVNMPVMSATDVMVEKLRAIDEHYCDFGQLLPVARALREQVDWGDVRRRTQDAPFAEAFLFLLDRLGVVDGGA